MMQNTRKPKKILFIDDTPAEIVWFKHIAKRHAVATSSNIPDAMSKKTRFDFVILDYSVINDYGLQKFEEIKKHFKCSVVLTSTAFPFFNYEDKGDHYVGKSKIKEYIEGI